MPLFPRYRMKTFLWLLVSPIPIFLALISTVESDFLYHAQLLIFGIWSLLAVFSGIGVLLKKHWASSMMALLRFLAVAYFTGAVVVIFSFLLIALINGGVANPFAGWIVSALVAMLLLTTSGYVKVGMRDVAVLCSANVKEAILPLIHKAPLRVLVFVIWACACSGVLLFVLMSFDGSHNSDLEIFILYLMAILTAPAGIFVVAAWQLILAALGYFLDFELKTSSLYLIGLWLAFFVSGVMQWLTLARWIKKGQGR